MAAARSPAGNSDAGAADGDDGDKGAERGAAEFFHMPGLAADGDICGSSNPAAATLSSPEKMAASKENPMQSSRCTTRIGSAMDLDDDVWDIRINLDGQNNLERCMCKSDITYFNLLALIEEEGYGINDCVYYVKEKGIGIAGLELLDGMRKVEHMVELYEQKKCLSLTVIKGGSTLPSKINSTAVEDDGVEDSEMMYIMTQQSNNKETGKMVYIEGEDEDELNQRLIHLKKSSKLQQLQTEMSAIC